MYVCMYTYMYVYMAHEDDIRHPISLKPIYLIFFYPFMHKYDDHMICIYVCSIYIYMYMYTYMYVYMYVCIHICMYIWHIKTISVE